MTLTLKSVVVQTSQFDCELTHLVSTTRQLMSPTITSMKNVTQA